MIYRNPVMAGSYSYHYGLVILSVLIAIVASYAALELAGRVTVARSAVRLLWLIGGATAMGTGIWSMHYVGMLAFSLPVLVEYDWPTVLLSLLSGISWAALALFVASRQTMGQARAWVASLFMGGGIATLHYTSMAAMRLPGMCHYSPPLVALSILLAVVFSRIALWLTFAFRNDSISWTRRKAAGALLMAAAISGMRYTAMAAATFTRSAAIPDLSHAVSISSLGSAGISIVALMVLAVALLSCRVNRVQGQRELLDELFEQAPEAVALMNLSNEVVRVNKEFTKIFGYSPHEILGRPLSVLIVPSELRDDARRKAELVAHGQRVGAESVTRRKDGSRLNVATVQVPVSVPGGLIAIYAVYRDITEHKRAEAALRTLSGRLLRSQDEERRRISRGLHDSTAQILASLTINLAVVNESANQLDPRAQRALAESEALADQCLREIRTVSYLLHPPELDHLGLQSALARYIDGFVQRSGIQIELIVPSDTRRLPPEIEMALFRIVQESLTNIHRHSGSNTAMIRLSRSTSEITLEVMDKGNGMSDAATPGVGIVSMRERAEQLGGWLEIGSQDGGTTLKAVIPLPSVSP
jgi:PAS domain S-box-containing protein